MSVPTEANQIVLQHLIAAEGPITLGLLPLTADEEERCIKQVVDYCNGNLKRLLDLIGALTPGAASYAIAAGASQAVKQGGAFWEPLSQRLNISLHSPQDRERLAGAFSSACRRLGVIDPDVSSMAWKNVAPMMAQASILHNWADSLGQGVQTAIKNHPLPDLEDQNALKNFAISLNQHIHNQPNLKKILQTEVGGIVVHRLISSCVYGRFEILPSHLIAPIRAAFESGGRQVSLKSPYVSFSTTHGGFELILPKQPGSLTSHATFWQVNGAQYSPLNERRLSEFEIGRRQQEIRLRNLPKGYPDQTFAVDLSLEHPFRVFDVTTLREKNVRIGGTTDLLPGEYLVVMKSDASSDEPDAEELRGDYRILHEITIRPGIEPLHIYHDDTESILSPALKAGIYHSADEGNSSLLECGLRLHYGKKFGFLAYIPKDQHSGSLRISITSKGSMLHESDNPLKQSEEGVYDYSTLLEKALDEVTTSLSPSIHPLRVKISTHATAVVRDLWYWKGLDHISRNSGFHCSSMPENIDFNRSKGIAPSSTGCGFLKGYAAPRIVIGLKGDDSISFLRPGISAACLDPEDGSLNELRNSETLTVGDRDSRVIAFESGGFEDWSLLCNGTEFATLGKIRVRLQIGLRSLMAQYGKSGRVEAQNSEGETIRIFGFNSGLIAKRLELNLDHGQGIERWKTTIPCEDLGRLAIQVLDYSESPTPILGGVTVLFEEGAAAEHLEETKMIAVGIETSVRLLQADGTNPNRLKVSVDVSPSKCASKLLFVDLLRAPKGTEDWQPMQCADGMQASHFRILVSGDEPFDGGRFTWWHHLWRVSNFQSQKEDISLYAGLKEEEVGQALNQISRLLTVKYPSSVYGHSAKYLTSLSHKLSTRRESSGNRDTNIWWREGALELETHAAATVAPVVRQFLFACNPHTLRRRWEYLASMEEIKDTGILSALALGASVKRAGGRLEYARAVFHEKRHPHELFMSFENSPLVFQGKATDFEGFDFQRFFRPIFGRVTQHDESASELNDAALLSAKHLLHCIKNLNRRARVLAKASNSDDTEHPLRSALHGLSDTTIHCHQLLPTLKTVIGYRPWTDSVNLDRPDHFEVPDAPCLPLLTSEQSSQLSIATWTLCALSRAAAHGLISSKEFTQKMEGFSGSNIQSHPINLMLSFAPELFAYYMALLDFALFNSKTSSSS
jgi:hypothetical protein